MEKKTDQFDSINFKPMTEGLGLNHFADGLPYTPTQMKRKPQAQFNFPPPRAPKTAPEVSVEAPVIASAPEVPSLSETVLVNAGSMRRMTAYFLDLVMVASIFASIVWMSFKINGFEITQLIAEHRGVQLFWPLVLLYSVVHLGYFLIQETTWRRTLGKALVGIRIRSNSGFATLGRAVCFFISMLPLGVGLLWCLFDSKHRCWHDVITDSEVVLN